MAGVIASLKNMKKYKGKGHVIAYSPHTGEEYSANPSDYWNAPDNWVMKDSSGHRMYLVVPRALFISPRVKKSAKKTKK